MLPSHATELAAAAAAALQRLDHYLILLDELLRRPDDAGLFSRNSDTFDAMRGLTSALPQVRACWVEVLISRFELLDALGKTRAPDDQLAALHEKHLHSLDHFRRLCWGYISSQLVAAPPAWECRPSAPARETHVQGAERRLLEGDRRVRRQRDLIERLETCGADASSARRVLRTMENALAVMHSNLGIAREQAG